MKLSTQILLAFTIILTLSLIDSFSTYVLSRKVNQYNDFRNRSAEVIRISGNMYKEMIEMQSDFRGYLLTGDSSFLEDYHSGKKDIPALFKVQKDFVKDNAVQRDILDSIQMLQHKWMQYADEAISSSPTAKVTNVVSQTGNLRDAGKLDRRVGRMIIENIGEKFNDFNKIEYKTRNRRGEELLSSVQKTQVFSWAFFSLSIIIGIGTAWYITTFTSKRINGMVQLAQKISKGEFSTVDDNRNDELTGLSTSLNIMSARLSKNISELERRNAELDKFAHVVSHDLKAPLRGIHNVSKWIEEDFANELSPELKKYLDIIPQRTRRMEDLINGLLDYARTRKSNEPGETDINKLVQDIVDAIVPRTMKVVMKELPVIIAERLELEQVFTNLISNAVKYTSQENGIIIIDGMEKKDHYEFSVKDNGIGIEPEYHEKIYEIFQTLRDKNEKESTGIGLAIVKKILDDRNCTIRVVSEWGKGAEFIFTWPRIKTNTNEA